MWMQFLSKYYAWYKILVRFIFRMSASGKPRPISIDIPQYLGLELVNINAYAFFFLFFFFFFLNIPHRSRDKASFILSEFRPRQSLNQWQRLLLCWCFTALRHILGHFGRGQLTLPHCSWASLLGSLPVLSAHSFASNWQLPFLNQRKGENDRRIYFMTKSQQWQMTFDDPLD